MHDFYKVLGIASTADDGRIKSAFRRRAKAFHPDLNPGDKRAEQRFKELTQAYEVLRSAHARACYDAFRARRRSEARRRFAQSAALMATSFMLTLGSAYAVLAWHGSEGSFKAGWQLAMSSTRVTDTTTSALARPLDSDADRPPPAAPIALASAAAPATEERTAAMAIANALPITKEHAAAPHGQAARSAPERPVEADRDAPIEWAKTTFVKRYELKPKPPLRVKAHTTLAAAARVPQRHPAAAERSKSALPALGPAAGDASWPWEWPWPAADGSYMGLGATNR